MTAAEEWRPVVGAEAFYEVSDLGHVRAIKSGRILKAQPHVRGYLNVCLFRAFGSGGVRTVHRLVADAFLGPRPPGLEVDHENGIKADNRRLNLKYITHLENVRRGRHRRSQSRCQRCRATDHYTKTCGKPRHQLRLDGKNLCHSCGGRGHYAKTCFVAQAVTP